MRHPRYHTRSQSWHVPGGGRNVSTLWLPVHWFTKNQSITHVCTLPENML